MRPRWLPAFPVMILAVAACSRNGAGQFATVPVARSSISQSVSASGTVNPQDTVLVGSQVSGTIKQILVDYNSRVRRGQVLARLDPGPFQAALDQANAVVAQMHAQRRAAGASAESSQYGSASASESARALAAQIAAADENVRKASSALHLAELTLTRDRTLFRQGYVAGSAVDADETNAASARAALIAAQTQAQSARSTTRASYFQATSSAAQAKGAAASGEASAAAAAGAEAAVRQAQLNLAHTTILSPVDGTVISRNVSNGQTVAAAFQSPTLFTIAKDLHKMQLEIAVGEPDVGTIAEGQRVEFSVLAYPGRTFKCKIVQLRQNPTVVNNVTTYSAIASVDNADGLLRPGMNATARIIVATYADALVVPITALQWRPNGDNAKNYRIDSPPQEGRTTNARSVWGQTGTADTAVSPGAISRVYVPNGRVLEGVVVRVLAIDGSRAAIAVVKGVLHRDDAVITGSAS